LATVSMRRCRSRCAALRLPSRLRHSRVREPGARSREQGTGALNRPVSSGRLHSEPVRPGPGPLATGGSPGLQGGACAPALRLLVLRQRAAMLHFDALAVRASGTGGLAVRRRACSHVALVVHAALAAIAGLRSSALCVVSSASCQIKHACATPWPTPWLQLHLGQHQLRGTDVRAGRRPSAELGLCQAAANLLVLAHTASVGADVLGYVLH